MPLRVKFRIESTAIASLAKRLAELDRKVARKAIRDGINEATQAVLWDAKALVPIRSGQLRKSLGRKVVSKRDGSKIIGIVGPRRGFRIEYRGKMIDPAKYAHLVEYGRREVVAKNKKVLASGVAGVGGLPGQGVIFGKRVRNVPPRPFLRPAWEQNKSRVVGIILKHLNLGVKKFYANARNKYGSARAA
jgi:HK97 gp10 family phage protein